MLQWALSTPSAPPSLQHWLLQWLLFLPPAQFFSLDPAQIPPNCCYPEPLSSLELQARAARYSEVKEHIALSMAPAVQQKDQKRELLNMRLSERLRKDSEFIKRANVAAKRNTSEKDEKLRFFLKYV